MLTEFSAAIIGGVIGGILGVIGTLIGSYYGPLRLEERREKIKEERNYGPRKHLLNKMLEDPSFPDGRTIETLSLVTGTTHKECRRLLIEIEARGVIHKGNKEGWALISKKPLKEE